MGESRMYMMKKGKWLIRWEAALAMQHVHRQASTSEWRGNALAEQDFSCKYTRQNVYFTMNIMDVYGTRRRL
jgi:hypothetical protein